MRSDTHTPNLVASEPTTITALTAAQGDSAIKKRPKKRVRRHGESAEPWFGDTYSDVHNLTGWPAAVVRAGTTASGLPIGVQLVAPPWREDVALAAAAVVESALGGWRPPPI